MLTSRCIRNYLELNCGLANYLYVLETKWNNMLECKYQVDSSCILTVYKCDYTSSYI